LELQIQQNNEKKNEFQNPKLWYFVWNDLKKTLNLSSSKPHIFSFKVHFEWFKKLWMCHLKIYKTYLKFKCNKTMTKQFNLKIQNYFNNSITKHEPRYTKQPISSSFLDQIEFFCSIESVNWKVTKFILTTKKE
jgi:hypothetical protein